MEHRCGHRRNLEARVTIRTRSGFLTKGLLRNVSASGALVSAPLPLPLHTVVLMQIDSPNARSFSRVAMTGEVSRVTADGFAIEWTEFAPHTLRAILRATEARRELPDERQIDVH